MEKIKVRITRPDFSMFQTEFINAELSKDEKTIYVHTKGCFKKLLASYPIQWAIEIIKIY